MEALGALSQCSFNALNAPVNAPLNAPVMLLLPPMLPQRRDPMELARLWKVHMTKTIVSAAPEVSGQSSAAREKLAKIPLACEWLPVAVIKYSST